MSDTRERLMAAFRPGKGPRSKADALLDAMREVAREEMGPLVSGINEYKNRLDDEHARLAALERRVAEMEQKWAEAQYPCGCHLDGSVLCADHFELSVPFAPDMACGKHTRTDPCDVCGASDKETPAPEPSEEAKLLLDCLEEIDTDNSPWQGLRTHMDDLRYCQRVIDMFSARCDHP